MDLGSKEYDNFRFNNFTSVGYYAVLVYILISLVDMAVVAEFRAEILFMRIAFSSPLWIFFLFKGLTPFLKKNIENISLFACISCCMGIAFVALNIGGIRSDYYFGIITASFLQFLILPLSRRKTLFFDVFSLSFYFLLLYSFAEWDKELAIKQISNSVSFIALKMFICTRTENLLKDALNKAVLEKDLEKNKNTQILIGELCHLFNNPLFISLGLTNKILKDNEFDDKTEERLNKVRNANLRMEKILKKMLLLQGKDNYSITSKDLHE